MEKEYLWTFMLFATDFTLFPIRKYPCFMDRNVHYGLFKDILLRTIHFWTFFMFKTSEWFTVTNHNYNDIFHSSWVIPKINNIQRYEDSWNIEKNQTPLFFLLHWENCFSTSSNIWRSLQIYNIIAQKCMVNYLLPLVYTKSCSVAQTHQHYIGRKNVTDSWKLTLSIEFFEFYFCEFGQSLTFYSKSLQV